MQLLDVDGKFGGKTKAAVIAFKRARKITPHTVTVDATTWEALARPPVSGKPRAGKAGPDYDQMFEDGLLEITIARGFDEHGNAGPETAQIIQGLKDVRGFEENAEKAHALRRAAGRPQSTTRGMWFVKENVGTSADKPVHAVVRVITPELEALGDGSDARRRGARGDGPGRRLRVRRPRPLRDRPRLRPQLPLHGRLGQAPGSPDKTGTEEFTDASCCRRRSRSTARPSSGSPSSRSCAPPA